MNFVCSNLSPQLWSPLAALLLALTGCSGAETHRPAGGLTSDQPTAAAFPALTPTAPPVAISPTHHAFP